MTSESTTSESTRAWTDIDRLAERWLAAFALLCPTTAGYRGVGAADPSRWDDYSVEGHARVAAEQRRVLSELERLTPVDETDRVTAAELRSQLTSAVARYDAGFHYLDVNVVSSPVQAFRLAIEAMPKGAAEDSAAVSARLRDLPAAVAAYGATLRDGLAQGWRPARRQVLAAAGQARRAAADGSLDRLVAESAAAGADDREVSASADAARSAFSSLAAALDDLVPGCGDDDAAGRERYALASEGFLGARIDLDETYEWALDELELLTAEMEGVAARVLPGEDVRSVIAHLDADPGRRIRGREALRDWMQRTSDEAMAALDGTAFDIPAPLRRLECMIAPSATGIIYYTGPSDDFERPGRMWWSVPDGIDEFSTWRERTTVFHEGVPGHHLQIGTAVLNHADLNAWRRLLAGSSGHAEGWALYSERLMDELGHHADPADRLGMLGAQRMRAARVVIDIGVHLRKRRPDGAGEWDRSFARDFLAANVPLDPAYIEFEIDRYLGWPGQAASYKVGQRCWEQLRAEAETGPGFDLRRFHGRALAHGGLGLDTLRSALRRDDVEGEEAGRAAQSGLRAH
ncbi:DUF885 domain-containing protein [Microbacterium sp. No. 7]|uniref:DUF885 domain-containing protein n=1 Tax=Microbacterium sp. No. 7 TaxID=1714373 RepID=UPI0006D0096E|nr:DUF885 domain-containing protein [Microbacterium sp. No. 7]ALJ20412.1 hypothetical protein AOA12_11055 [Microbacterium sp. No. 7]